jgi:hypothetical protein
MDIAILFFRIALVCSTVLFVCVGCASVPTFRPSVAVEGSSSFQEGLLLCDEYRLPIPAVRSVMLRPFVECVDQVAEVHAAVSGTDSFRLFRDELHRIYSLVNDVNWSSQLGADLEVAIHAVFRALWREGGGMKVGAYTVDEQALAERYFPRTTRFLRSEEWPTSESVVIDSKLEALSAGLSSLSSGGARSAQGVAQENVAPARLCTRYLKLFSEVGYLSQLWLDQQDLNQIDPGSKASEVVRKKYASRLGAAAGELESLRSDIKNARQAGTLRTLSCGSS